jgi:hypothetical protein
MCFWTKGDLADTTTQSVLVPQAVTCTPCCLNLTLVAANCSSVEPLTGSSQKTDGYLVSYDNWRLVERHFDGIRLGLPVLSRSLHSEVTKRVDGMYSSRLVVPVHTVSLLADFLIFSIYPEDGGDTFLRNVGEHHIYTVSHPRRLLSSSHFCFYEENQ